VLDLGCGEGTNAAWLTDQSCRVTAVDVSAAALRNALAKYPQSSVGWLHADAITLDFPPESFDLVVAYGLMHCLTEEESSCLIVRMKQWTRVGGANVIVAFNDRDQDLSGHPGFQPTLRAHDSYVEQYDDWQLLLATDRDLYETHPHNGIPHHHSMTRIAARRSQ
jgi:ubiquinone/menaquinone biosynthesis C-methylase UbiE